jgi:hypothetical protein
MLPSPHQLVASPTACHGGVAVTRATGAVRRYGFEPDVYIRTYTLEPIGRLRRQPR